MIRCTLLLAAAAAAASVQPINLEWRSIGPAMFGGRVADIAGVPGNPRIIYIGHSSAGLYKSTNGGTTFDSVFNDGGTLSVGAVALEPGDPNVVYLGTGEGKPRNSISYGDGVYKSTDGGKTWKHSGLKNSERFSRIVAVSRTHVLAAVMGRAFGPSSERGVYRSTDGGATWTRTLFANDTTGASDLAVDPQDPNIVYAGMYDYQRRPWHFRSGGPGSGLYRSADGGVTWSRISNGLPAGVVGRIGLAIARSNPKVVYALVESREGVLWRSTDRGLSFTLVSRDNRINRRPFYFSQVRVDPADENRIYCLSGDLMISDDAGKTFTSVGYSSFFGDHHTLWIDPQDRDRLLGGSDGGFYLSNDRGKNWDFVNNMPMAQPYHVGIDMAEPYNVLGGFQDHELWRGPNEKWNEVGVREGDWKRMRNMADGMYTVPDPRDPNIVYYNGHFGDITRIDMRSGEERFIQPYPVGPSGGGADREKYRFNWNSPILMSHANPDVLYYAGNVVFKTTDGGATWSVISPDLTTNDPEKQKLSGGPINPDNTRAEFHCTILALAESPRDANVLWAGTDDGNVQLTRDGGSTWTNVTPPDAPKSSWVAAIHTSHRDPGSAYLAIDQHRLDDFAPHAFVTHDYGRTWKRISQGLRGYVHIVMEDPKQPSLLYAGTELGIWASFDRGATWTDLRLGLPPLSVVDMKVHPRDNDLVIATHARGFYILDDITPLQNLAAARAKQATLFPPLRATRYVPASDTSSLGDRVWVAKNKPYGASLSFYMAKAGPASLTILDGDGRELRTLETRAAAGVNRAVWNLEPRGCGPGLRAPRVLPGQYKVRLNALGEISEQPLTVRLDPRLTVSDADLKVYGEQVALLHQTQCAISAMQADIRKAVAANHPQRAELERIGNALNSPPRDPEHENIFRKLAWLVDQVGGCTCRPTAAQIEWIGRFADATRDYRTQLDAILKRVN